MSLGEAITGNPYPIVQPKQQAFLDDPAKYKLIGGAQGGGKSHACRIEGFRTCNQIPSVKGLVMRRTRGEAVKNFIDPLMEETRLQMSDGTSQNYLKWLPSSSKILFPNGSRIDVGFCESESDVERYRGLEYDWICIEELTQWPFLWWRKIMTALRTKKERIHPFFFGSTNPGGVGHCVPFGEVLTKNGWKDISKVNTGESVATVGENDEIIFVDVLQKTAEDFDGELMESQTATASIVCTPNHKIARKTETKNQYGRKFHGISLVEAQDLPKVIRLVQTGKWVGMRIETFSVPELNGIRKTKLNQPMTISGDDYCDLMGWYLAEGCTIDCYKSFSITQLKIDGREKIAEMLDRIGFKYQVNDKGFTICSPRWWNYLRQFGKCREKYIPKEILNATTHQMEIFLSSAMMGDGHGKTYYTTSHQLADDMQELGLKIGKRPALSSRQRENRDGLSYEIVFKDDRLGWVERASFKNTRYKGKVYCLGIEKYHRFFLRQEGRVWLSGNSWVKRLWLNKEYMENENPKDYGMTRAGIYDNPILMKLDPEYLPSLMSLPDKERRARLDGDWDVFEGQYFAEWRRDIHVVRPFIPMEGVRRRIVCGDYGYSPNPSAVYWLALLNSGFVICYRELWETKLRFDQLAMRVDGLTTEAEEIECAVFDPSICSKESESGNTFDQAFQSVNLAVIAGNNKRLEGANLFHRYLSPFEDPNTGRLISRFIVTENCTNLIRTIPELVHDSINVEDVHKKGDDHCITGDTIVETLDGSFPISSLVGTTGLAVTHLGVFPYRSVRLTIKNAKIVRLTLENGKAIRLTPDHRVLTTRGWVAAKDLSIGYDYMIQCDTCAIQSSYQEQSKSLQDCDTISVDNISDGTGCGFIQKYGNQRMENCEKAGMSTIKTGTDMTTDLKTLRRLVRHFIQKCIVIRRSFLSCIAGYLLIMQSQKQKHGIKQSAGGTGIVKWQDERGKSEKQRAYHVNFVEEHSIHSAQTVRNTVIKIVRREPCGSADVYNMTVPRTETFCIEGGLIVHNSYDAVRYGLMEFGDIIGGVSTLAELNDPLKKSFEQSQRTTSKENYYRDQDKRGNDILGMEF